MSEENRRKCYNWLIQIKLLTNSHSTTLTEDNLDLGSFLKDGVQLCQILNIIYPGCIDLKEISQQPKNSEYLCLRNIRIFLQICKLKFGLKEDDLFSPDMLYDQVNLDKVIFTLSKLSHCPKVTARGIRGFSASDNKLCDNMEELTLDKTSNNETPVDLESKNEDEYDRAEHVYEEICYVRLRVRQPQQETPKEKRDYIKRELLDTESDYVDMLNMIHKRFILPVTKLLKDDDMAIIFYGIKELCNIHTGLLSDLISATNNSKPNRYSHGDSRHKSLGDVFIHWKNKLAIYGEYCSNLSRAEALVTEICQKNDQIALLVMSCEKAVRGGHFSLGDYLRVPMQRVLKYHLLLKSLLDATKIEQYGVEEFKSIKMAWDAMKDLAQFTNEMMRDNEKLKYIQQIQGRINNFKMVDGMDLNDYGSLRQEGELRIRIRGHDDDNRIKFRYFLLFDKVMIICKTTRMMDKFLLGEHYSYKDTLYLQDYRLELIPNKIRHKTGTWDGRATQFPWSLVHLKEKIVCNFYAQTEKDKSIWLNALQDALSNLHLPEYQGTDHHWTMHSFPKGLNCSHCGRFLKGLFYQGYKCLICDARVHKACICEFPKCKSIQTTSRPLPRAPPMGQLGHAHSFAIGQNTPNSKPVSRPLSMPASRRQSQASQQTCLQSYPWFAGEMDRDDAKSILMDEGQQNGAFLVRVKPGTLLSDDASYSLSLRWNNEVKHMKVFTTPDMKQYCLSDLKIFKSLVELINWYQHNSLAESFSGFNARLERPYQIR